MEGNGRNETSKAAENCLTEYLGKTLRIQITDGRMFIGSFKCVDKVGPVLKHMKTEVEETVADLEQDSNVILSTSHEHRPPTKEQLETAKRAPPGKNPLLAATSRYIGLIVVPGQHITKIETEEFDASRII